MEEILKALGGRIWQLRGSYGLTQEALAEKIDLHPSYVGLIERGQKSPSLRTLNKIADFFNVDISDLLLKDESWNGKDVEKKQIMMTLDGKSIEDLEKIRGTIEIIFS